MAEIEAWIARDNPAAAIRVADRLLEAGHEVGQSPEQYRAIGGRSVRVRVVDSYVLLYRIKEEVQILRVMHGAQDWLNLVDDL